jgi:hypothetical protein
MRSSALLVIGHNFLEADFMMLWREMLEHMGGFAVGAYAVSPGLPIDQQQIWVDRQVRILDIEPTVLLEELGRLLQLPQSPIATSKEESAATDSEDVVALRRFLISAFSDSELNDLCFDLGVDYENLPGQTKGDKARELIRYAERHRLLNQLIGMSRKLRPHSSWPDSA